jgi:diacylglycerol O-acyltransferase / wax synthase
MAIVRQMSAADALFIAGDTETTYNHTAGLMILDPTGVDKFDFRRFRKSMARRIGEIAQFSWRLHEVSGGLDRPYWVENPDFNPENHIRRAAVPAPGDAQALADTASLIFSRHLDRRKPLWEVWFIEGLENGRVAVMLKLHHCMMDGDGALRLMAILCDTEPFPSRSTVKKAIAVHEPGRAPTGMEESFRTALHLLRLPGQTTRNLLELALPAVRKQLAPRKKQAKSAQLTLHPRLNADIGPERGYVYVSLPLSKILRIKKHHGVTVNEVLLAVLGGAMRRYLEQAGDLPRQSLRTSIPVSLRVEGDDSLDNQVTNVPVTLATNQKDPVKRLMAIHRESAKAKKQAKSGAKGATEIVQAWPPFLVGALINSVSPEQAAQMLRANLILSNVRGPSSPFYVSGARLEAMYPMSVITPGLACNVTCVSYCDQVAVGIVLDPDALPHPERITREMTRELNALQASTRKKT